MSWQKPTDEIVELIVDRTKISDAIALLRDVTKNRSAVKVAIDMLENERDLFDHKIETGDLI